LNIVYKLFQISSTVKWVTITFEFWKSLSNDSSLLNKKLESNFIDIGSTWNAKSPRRLSKTFLVWSFLSSVLLSSAYWWRMSGQSILLIDWQLIVGWGTDSSITEVLDFTTIPYTNIVSCSHLNYPWLNFGNGIFLI